MRLELTGRHITITASMRRAVLRELEPLQRLLNASAHSAQVVVTSEKGRFKVEATAHVRGDKFLHGEATGREWEVVLGAAFDKIRRQAEKLKSRWTERKRQVISPAKAASAAPRP